MFEGKITKGVGGLYTVTTNENVSFNCKARGLFRKEKLTPCVGDNVVVSDSGYIESIHTRKNILVRPPVSNIDYLGIIVSAEKPYADLLMLDKLTVSAYYLGIIPFVVINKCDIANKNDINNIKTHLFGTSIDFIETDCTSENGLIQLLQYLKPGITAFAGQSGVGKTSILNVLLPTEQLEVGNLSEKLERGRHTTRHVELHTIKKGIYLMDTPGFSKYDTEVPSLNELPLFYPEFRRFQKECSFNSCTHIHEPDCAIKNAVNNGIISKSRYNNYIKIYEQIKSRKAIYKK